jgi:hypothetical protein
MFEKKCDKPEKIAGNLEKITSKLPRMKMFYCNFYILLPLEWIHRLVKLRLMGLIGSHQCLLFWDEESICNSVWLKSKKYCLKLTWCMFSAPFVQALQLNTRHQGTSLLFSYISLPRVVPTPARADLTSKSLRHSRRYHRPQEIICCHLLCWATTFAF